MIVLIFCLAIPLVLYFVWSRYQKFGLRERLGYNGPENQNFFFGDLPKMDKSVVPETEFHLILSGWLKTYGPVFGWYHGTTLAVVVSDLDILKEIFIKKFANFINHQSFAGQQGSTISMVLGFLKSKQWKHTRNAMTPAFTSKKMRLVLCNIFIKLSEDEIIAQALVILLAGFETTSTALSYTTWLLAKHPSVQEKLHDEIDQLVGNKLLDHDIALSLPYLDAVFHEALRMYPHVVSFVERSCSVACEINGYKFEPGMQVVAPVYAIHHNPEIWPDLEKFDPQRFIGARNYHRMAWLPFGAGPRNCIGLRFAEMEYKMTIIETVRQFTIKLGPDSPNEIEIKQKGLILRPQRVMVRLDRR